VIDGKSSKRAGENFLAYAVAMFEMDRSSLWKKWEKKEDYNLSNVPIRKTINNVTEMNEFDAAEKKKIMN
jgi:hypothetical protein